MTTNEWLHTATERLQGQEIETARLDALVLLEDALKTSRAQILAHPEITINDEQLLMLDKQLDTRSTHTPLAYIRGHAEFYGRKFVVNDHVLVPRPESETIIELLKKVASPKDLVADIGTGSGALAITAVLETGAAAVAVDIDEACLAVASQNALMYSAKISCLQGDLIEPFLSKAAAEQPTILLCNLPYVPTDFEVNTAAKHEPALALYGGTDGLDLYRTLFAQTLQLSKAPRIILTESLPSQHVALAVIAQKAGYKLQISADFIQQFGRALT